MRPPIIITCFALAAIVAGALRCEWTTRTSSDGPHAPSAAVAPRSLDRNERESGAVAEPKDEVSRYQIREEPGSDSASLLARARDAAQVDPMLALRLAEGLSRETERRDIITLAVGQWAAIAPEAAAVWADGLEDPQLRSRALAAVIAAWAEKSPSAAATLARDGLSAGAEREAALLGVMQRWAQLAPGSAAAWLGSLPDGDLRGLALPVLVETWAAQDALRCGEWLNGLLIGRERDVAVEAYAMQLASTSSATAAQWAESIGDRAMRERTLTDVARTWIGRDADAAEPWLRRAAIPETVKTRLLALRHEASPGGR